MLFYAIYVIFLFLFIYFCFIFFLINLLFYFIVYISFINLFCSFILFIYILAFFFLGGSGQHIFSAFVAFSNRSAKIFSSVVQQLKFFFHKPVDFPSFGWYSQWFKISAHVSSATPSNSFRNDHFQIVRIQRTVFTFSFLLSIPTGIWTSLQVQFKSYVLVGGIGCLLQIFSTFCFGKLIIKCTIYFLYYG